MGTAPRFSVIMPVYNVGAYLDESVGSVLAQTYGDYEVILVDDGSTDGSGEKCDVYAAGHPNFRVIHQENRGLLLARRAGLTAAEGHARLGRHASPRCASRDLGAGGRACAGHRCL